MLSIEVVKTRYCTSFTKPNYGNNALSSPACCLTYFGCIEQNSTVLWTCCGNVCIWDVMLCRDNSVEAGHGHLTVMNTQCSQCAAYTIYTLKLVYRELSWQYKWNLYLVQLLCSLTDRTGAGALTGQYSRAMTVVHCYEAAAVMKY